MVNLNSRRARTNSHLHQQLLLLRDLLHLLLRPRPRTKKRKKERSTRLDPSNKRTVVDLLLLDRRRTEDKN
jgi:hypothetical protein